MTQKLQNRIKELFDLGTKIKQKTLETCSESIEEAARMIAKSFEKGGKLMICGNGGSAGDAQHIACEFVCRLCKDFERKALPAIALTTDTSFLTAYMNDYGIKGIFARQVEALAKPDDILLAISTSGTSGNVVEAVNLARSMGVKIITLTGSEGILSTCGDVNLAVPGGSDTNRIQESHICIYHVMVDLVECIMFDKPH